VIQWSPKTDPTHTSPAHTPKEPVARTALARRLRPDSPVRPLPAQ
jgi:hypothetical protein